MNGSTIWIDIRMKTAEIGQCINLFFKTAKEVGMTVSDAASKELKKHLKMPMFPFCRLIRLFFERCSK